MSIAAIKAFNRFNPTLWLRNLTDNDLAIITNAGAPTNGTTGTFAKMAGKGCLLIDTTNGLLYINTNTKASPTWTKVGTQV